MTATLTLFEGTAPSAAAPDTTPGYVYRRRILRLRSKDERREAIAAIADPQTRALVKFYIADFFARLHHRALPCLACVEAEEGLAGRAACRHSPR